MPKTKHYSGFTMIEVLIATFVIGVTVVGLFGLFVLTIRTVQEGKRRVVAAALANERMERVRNLPYAEVGTVGGIPEGAIEKEKVVVRNGLEYTVETDIRYVDDPFDGTIAGGTEPGEGKVAICHKQGTPAEQTLYVPEGALNAHLDHGDTEGGCSGGGGGSSGSDSLNTDYKQVRVEVKWNSQIGKKSWLLITYVAPSGMEGGDVGGTLDFQALDSAGLGVQGATVTLFNDSVDPVVDIVTQTNDEGKVILPGLPEAASSYVLGVMLNGYTSEQTYDITADFIPDADHSHLSALMGELIEKTFVIDRVARLTVMTEDDAHAALPNISYSLLGTKTIGVDGLGELVYKVDEDTATDGIGQKVHENLEWDSYSLAIDGSATGYDIKESSLVLPLVVNPADVLDLTLTLVEYTPISLHVTVVDPEGAPVDNATVQLTDNGVDETLGTGILGQVLFEDLPVDADYTLNIDAPGFEAAVQLVKVVGTTKEVVELIVGS